MFRPAIVTGYIPIKGHPRSAKEYGELGEKLFTGLGPIHSFYETVEDTWLHAALARRKLPVSHSVADNPQKNSLEYHCTQHQKFDWLLHASLVDKEVDTFVWVDYGLGHLKGMSQAVLSAFLAKVRSNDFAIPGCWTRPEAEAAFNYLWPCWRYCGGVMVVPRGDIERLGRAIKGSAMAHIAKTGNVDWEVNSLFRAEPSLPGLRWFKADHDLSLLENYK